MSATVITTTKSIRFGFDDDTGKSMSITYSGIKDGVDTTTMKNVFDALIANKEAFERAPTELTSVTVIDTKSEDYPLDNFVF